MKKKVLVCAYSCVSESGVKNIGGEAELGWNLVKQMGRFFDVYVLTHSYNQKSIEALMAKEKLLNIHFCYIKLSPILSFLENFHKGGIQIYSYLWQIKSYFVAKKLHEEIKFDAFHHITYANDWMASYIGALLKVPYLRGPGGGAHRVPDAFMKEYSFKERLSDKVRTIGQWLFRHDPFFIMGQNRAKKILVCNREAFDILPKKWKDKAEFFPVNGASIKDIACVNGNNNNDIFSVISAGKLIKIKGFDLAIKAFKVFSENNYNSKLVIVGDGPELSNLKNLAKKLCIDNKVIFKGWLSHGDLMNEIGISDLFIFCSLRDGGGAVVVEAMAEGKPVVCFDLAGPGFHVDDSCGIKVKAENSEQAVKDMAMALEKLYSDKELRLRLGKGAREKAEREYDWDKLGSKLNEIYKVTVDCQKVL
ncbi:MAG: glycosyltransferase [Candidatus Staskawiczbacteria bacterium]|nr:glycosyltransferase [Candidatus Staskawiczbacteria bacterium]